MWWMAIAMAAPVQVPVQGTMSDVAGAPMHGTFSATFRVWKRDGGGQLVSVWSDSYNVAFDRGTFAAFIGPLDGGTFAEDAWVSVQVGTAPDSAAVPVGWAPRAAWAADAGAVGGQSLAQLDTRYPRWGSGNTLTVPGALTVQTAPSASDHAATKGYVDAATSTLLPRAGGALSGALSLAGAPTEAGHAASKGYVDGQIAGAAFLPIGGGTLTGGLSGTTGAFSGAVTGGSFALPGGAPGFAVSALGALTAASVGATGAVSGASLAATGAVTGGSFALAGGSPPFSVSTIGAVTAASLSAAGAVSAASVVATGAVSGQTVKVGTAGSTCDSSRTGTIEFTGGAFRGCDGSNWRILDGSDNRPVLKASASTYTMAQVRTATAGRSGSDPLRYGSGNICETGYHICTYQEGLVLKYAFPPSRHQLSGSEYYRTSGTYSAAEVVGTTNPHNAMIGYNDGGSWGGTVAGCGDGRGPMLYFYNGTQRGYGLEWEGGCYTDDQARPWLCCLNRAY